MIDQPTSPEYEGQGCPECGNDNADGDIYLLIADEGWDEDGYFCYLTWKCEQCDHEWGE